MMFRPRESHDLRLVSTKLDIQPRPSDLRWLHDVFDNSVAIATFDAAASELRFDSTVTLEHIETALPDYALEIGARTYPFQYSDDERPDLTSALTRRYPGDDLGAWTSRFLTSSGSTNTMALLHSMTRGIKEEFAYLRRSEKGVQSPAETLRRRTGSCRDFAVLMIEAVRSLGVAARFVSGYIFVPDANRADVVGDGATHGWMQAYLPGAGWIDFDPTNNIRPALEHVTLAWGRDYGDVAPLRGVIRGGTAAPPQVEVTVAPAV